MDIQPKNLHRLVSEALNISRSKGHVLLNRKGEFGKMHLPRLTIKENINEAVDKETHLGSNLGTWASNWAPGDRS